MTNAQLYILLTPALVSLFGVFFAAWRTDKRLDDLRADSNRKFDELRADNNRKFDEMSRRFDELRADMNRQFDKTNHTLETIQQDLTRFHGIQSAQESEIGNLKERMKT